MYTSLYGARLLPKSGKNGKIRLFSILQVFLYHFLNYIGDSYSSFQLIKYYFKTTPMYNKILNRMLSENFQMKRIKLAGISATADCHCHSKLVTVNLWRNSCRGLTRAIYILSIEHLRMTCLSRESNPGPPALQASTLWKEPFERPYLVAIRDLTCFATQWTNRDNGQICEHLQN